MISLRGRYRTPIRFVGYSHGGNIAILAANILHQQHGIPVETLITIGTPVREYQLLSGAVGQHINVYNTRDAVQVIGGGRGCVFAGMSVGMWRTTPVLVPAGRTFTGAENVRVTVPDGMNPFAAHRFMHQNDDIWRRYFAGLIRR